MRILQHIDFFSSGQGGGATAAVYKISKALGQAGHDVRIYASDAGADKGYASSLQGVRVHRFRNWTGMSRLCLTPGMFVEAKRRLSEFDVTHLHWHRSFQAVVIGYYARKYGIPYIVDDHGTPGNVDGAKTPVQQLWRLFDILFGYRLLRDASKVITETEIGVNEYTELGVQPEKIALISPPFDIEEFSRLPARGAFRKRFNIEAKYLIMFLGRLHWIKGIDFLIESFGKLVRDRDDVVLAIVGPDDGHGAALDSLVKRLGLSGRVVFTGFLGGDDKLSALVDADLVVQTSVYEHGVGVPFEAVLCNTPIVVSSHTGAGEIIRKIDGGYLVEYGNTDALADAVQYVLNNPADAAVKTQKAKEYIIANLSLEKGVTKYADLYAECIRDKPRRP